MKILKSLTLAFKIISLVPIFCISIGVNDIQAQEIENQGFIINAELSVLSDSNVQRNSIETADNLVTFSPQISYLNNIGKHEFSAIYNGTYAKYSELSLLDYENHMGTVGILFDHTTSLSTQFNASYEDAIERPGSTNGVLNNTDEFNQRQTSQMLAAIFYGTRESKGQVVLTVDYSTLDYASFAQRFRNTDTTSISGSYFYRIAPGTRLVFGVGTTDFSYTNVDDLNDQSSQQNSYSTGIEWLSSAQTTSVFSLGYQTRDYQNPLFEDDENLSYGLDFIWEPRSYTQITFGADRASTESAILGASGIVRNTYSIGLQHELSTLIVLNGAVEYGKDDILSRTDTNTSVQVGLRYSAKHWLDISLSYLIETRESEDVLFDYDAEIVQLSFISRFD